MNGPSERVLDTSAVLAALFGEPGGEGVMVHEPPAVMSAVNAAEVLAQLFRRGMPVESATQAMAALDLAVVPFGNTEAVRSARFAAVKGLSLRDRACLAAADVRRAPAVTADREWKKAVKGGGSTAPPMTPQAPC